MLGSKAETGGGGGWACRIIWYEAVMRVASGRAAFVVPVLTDLRLILEAFKSNGVRDPLVYDGE